MIVMKFGLSLFLILLGTLAAIEAGMCCVKYHDKTSYRILVILSMGLVFIGWVIGQ